MAELMLVGNPHRRHRRKNARRRRHRNARRRRMPAALRAYWARRNRHHRRNPHRVHRRRRNLIAPIGNPHRRRRRNWIARMGNSRRRRRHHNPMSLRGFTGSIMPTVRAGAWGAAGGLGLDFAWGLVNNQLPGASQYLSNPYVALAAKGVLAVAVGAVGGRLFRGRGRDLAVGGMTVVLHDFFRTTLEQLAPAIFGAGGSFPLGAYLSGYGAYLSGAAPIVGTATVPQSYLPFSGAGGGPGAGDTGVFQDDSMGEDFWAGSTGIDAGR